MTRPGLCRRACPACPEHSRVDPCRSKETLLISLLSVVVVISAASNLFAGSIKGWGYNDSGECNVPEPISGIVAFAAGGVYSLGLKAEGSIVAWGDKYDVPSPNSGFVAVAAGGWHSLGLFGVNFSDLSIFANQWAQTCAPPGWCRGYDYDRSGLIDVYDLAKLADFWLGGLD